MADKDVAEAPAEENAEAKEGGGKKRLLSSPPLKIGLFVLLLGVNAFVSFVIVDRVIRPKVEKETVQEEIGRPSIPEPGDLFLIEEIIVNPSGTRATRYLRMAAALEYEMGNAEMATELEQRSYQFRDLLITELGSRTLDELVDARVKEEIREELLARLNSSLATGKLQNLYFTEYVIQ